MVILVTQDRDGVCEVWKGSVSLMINKLGMFVPGRQGKLIAKITKKLCKTMFGHVPRPKTAIRIRIEKLALPVPIRKQK